MRLIDAHKLHNALYEVYEKHRKEGNEYICEVMSKQIEPILLAASTVDAVKVVRCGICKQSYVYVRDGEEELYCGLDDYTREPEDYCSYGEREDAE